MKVAVVVSEFYPRAHDPVLGLWAHRQALAARDAGADVRVLVLHRPIPPPATAPRDCCACAPPRRASPRRATLDGLDVRYVRFLSPPRPRSYGSWGAWAAPTLALALRRLRRTFAFDVVHAHNAVPAGDAVLRAGLGAPLVVSVHGSDVFHTARRHEAGARPSGARSARARLVLANSAGVAAAARDLGAAAHARAAPRHRPARAGAGPAREPTLVTVATSSPASATPTSCARSRCCATVTRGCAT